MNIITEKDSYFFSQQDLGGKAYNLSKLASYGLTVPSWCVIPSSFLKQKMDENKEIHFSNSETQELKNWLEEQKNKGSKSFIVRSSLHKEDGVSQSFAGQLESFPHLSHFDDIVDKIKLCAKSANSEKMNAYSKDNTKEVPSVIVQVMIDADVSGVLFTADPKDGSRHHFLVSSLWGACEGVVNGQWDCDEYSVALSPFKVTSKVANKENMMVFAEQGLKATPVPQNKQNKSSLSEENLKQIVNVGKKLTHQEGFPVDVEWLINNNELIIVQMRPITQLNKDTSQNSQFVFDNSNIQESFYELTLPLTFQFAKKAYYHVYSQLMGVMGFSKKTIEKHDQRHQNMLSLIKGRVYYNINSWYEGLKLLPSFQQNKADMEYMMGVEEPVDFVSDHSLTFFEKLKKIPSMIILLARLSYSFIRIDHIVKNFMMSFDKVYKCFPRQNLIFMKPIDLLNLHEELNKKVLKNWKAPIINDFYTMMATGKVRKTLKKIEQEDMIANLIAAEELESTKPTKQLIFIAEKIRKNEKLKNSIDTDFFRALNAYPEIKKDIDLYMEKYGDRVVGELKLETETLRENPNFLIQILKSYVNDDSLNLKKMKQKQFEIQTEAEKVVFSKIKKQLGFFSLYKFKKHLKSFRKAVVFREAMRLSRTQSFGMTRSIYIALGKQLENQNWLEKSSDIFYLTSHEIEGFFFAQSFFDTPKTLVEMRKKQYETWEKESLKSHIKVSVPFSQLPKKEKPTNFSSQMKGLGCYPGQIEGEVVVMKTPLEKVNLKDKILVAERTDPGWTPLFVQIKGLIVEKGSQLSHSAVIARELGIPTVVAVSNVCEVLKTGDHVVLDGQEGTIYISEKKTTTNIENKSLA